MTHSIVHRRVSDPVLSVVAPMHNEEGNVRPLVEALSGVIDAMQIPYEIVLVDDGSRDGTWNNIKSAATDYGTVAGVSLARNFGHQRALLAGLSHARGQAVISMDGDLQHPPDLIPQLYEAWRQGYKVVNTQRLDQEITGTFKRASSRYFYKLFSNLSEVQMSSGSSDFRLLDRQALDALLDLKASELFIRGAVQWLGFPSITVPFEVKQRFSGRSKYSMRRMFRFATDAIISFSTKPLRIGIWLGIATSMLAFLELVYVIVQYFRGGTVSGWASTVGIVSFLFGVLFVILGIIGSYLAWIHQALHNRPPFIVREVTDPARD